MAMSSEERKRDRIQIAYSPFRRKLTRLYSTGFAVAT